MLIMAFDFKKEYKEFYMPGKKPEIVNVPKANYIAVRGTGDPNEEGGAVLDAFLAENGYTNDMADGRLHHEIYLSDPKKSAPERMKTVIQHLVK